MTIRDVDKRYYYATQDRTCTDDCMFKPGIKVGSVKCACCDEYISACYKKENYIKCKLYINKIARTLQGENCTIIK